MNENTIGWVLIGIGAYLVWGKSLSKPSEAGVTGIGAGGQRRFGQPKTDEERRAQHMATFGTTELPPRGTASIRSIL